MNEFNFRITDNNITKLVERSLMNVNNNVELEYVFREFLKYKNCYEKTPSELTLIVFDKIFGEYASKAINLYYLKYVNTDESNSTKELKKLSLVEFEFVLNQYMMDDPSSYKKYVELLETDIENNEHIQLLKDCCNSLNIDTNYLLDDIEAYKINMFFDKNK